jgi:hypothetical protein
MTSFHLVGLALNLFKEHTTPLIAAQARSGAPDDFRFASVQDLKDTLIDAATKTQSSD